MSNWDQSNGIKTAGEMLGTPLGSFEKPTDCSLSSITAHFPTDPVTRPFFCHWLRARGLTYYGRTKYSYQGVGSLPPWLLGPPLRSRGVRSIRKGRGAAVFVNRKHPRGSAQRNLELTLDTTLLIVASTISKRTYRTLLSSSVFFKFWPFPPPPSWSNNFYKLQDISWLRKLHLPSVFTSRLPGNRVVKMGTSSFVVCQLMLALMSPLAFSADPSVITTPSSNASTYNTTFTPSTTKAVPESTPSTDLRGWVLPLRRLSPKDGSMCWPGRRVVVYGGCAEL